MTQGKIVVVEVAGNGWILNMFQSYSLQNLLVDWIWNLRGVNDDCKDFASAAGQIEFPSTMGAGGAVDGRILKTKVKRVQFIHV